MGRVMIKKLIELELDKRTVFIGDTHGDLDTTKKIVEKFQLKDHRLVFLGDYVDRGEKSKENLDFLLKFRAENSSDVIMLLGNHETYSLREYYPSDFWEELDDAEIQRYSEAVLKLPLAVSVGSILALHGALPLISSLAEIEKIKYDYTDHNFDYILWGDYDEKENMVIPGRKMFYRAEFDGIMEKLGKKVLLRGHDPRARLTLFDKRCVTIISSTAYGKVPKVAVAEPGKALETADDLTVLEIT
jgi:predicted phosphodiesterase